MACQDCLRNCTEIISDRCVQYTGPEIPLLGICPGDTLYEFEVAIANELSGLLDGSGIEPTNVTISCPFLTQILAGASPNLSNVLQMLITANCTLKSLIDNISSVIANPVFNVGCLTGLPANPSRDDILQATINLLCSLNTTVSTFPTTYVKNSDLTNLVTNIVNAINGGNQTVVNQKLIPYAAMPYFGPLSNFDGSGAGLAAMGFDKVYICNGQNGTPDIRGRAVTGAVRGVPGSLPLDAAVDPNSTTYNPNLGLGDKYGACFHQLTTDELPAHAHGYSDPGHKHQSRYRQNLAVQSGSSTPCWAGNTDQWTDTTVQYTNLSMGQVGSNFNHNNMQPVIAAWWIMYIP